MSTEFEFYIFKVTINITEVAESPRVHGMKVLGTGI